MDGIAQDVPVAGEGGRSEAVHTDRAGRDAAFTALMNRHGLFLYRVALGLLRNRQDAEDAVQETFLKLYRGEGWRGMEDERAFLARSVWNAGLNRLATAGAKAMRHAEDADAMDLVSAMRSPEQLVMANSERALMRSLIEELPETLRQPLVLFAIEGMRSQQVAAILGVPEGTVRTRVMRAKLELRRRFLETTVVATGVRP